MPTLVLLYLLKANFMLLLFAVAYFGLLRRLTFFTLNRAYLAFALLFSAVYPALPVPALLPAVAVAPALVLPEAATAASLIHTAAAAVPAFDWAAAGLGLYAAGAAGLLGWLLVQLVALGRVRRLSRLATVQGVPVRTLAGAAQPFSFGQTIYLNPAQHPAPELAAVLRHELVHVRQWHTLDVLLAQLALALAWCNPAAWLLRRAVLDNLEFLADHAVLQTGLDRRDYQYSLVRLSHGPAGPALVSHFTFFTLKNRVAMMNTPLSSTGQLARYLVAGPLVLALALGWSAARAQSGGPGPTQAGASAKGALQSTVSPQPGSKTEPTTHQLPAGIRSYIAATYPSAKLTSWAISEQASAKAPHVKYLAGISEGDTRHMLYFNAEEQLVERPTQAASVFQDGVARSATTAEATKNNTTPPTYYVDGQLFRGDINTIMPTDIASINVVKGARARQLFGAFGDDGVVLITTKTNQSKPEVLAFNAKNSVAAPGSSSMTPASAPRVAYLAAPALAYITTHYPNARLLGVAEVPAADSGTPRYQAEVVLGRRPTYLLFDAQGQFLAESPTSYAR